MTWRGYLCIDDISDESNLKQLVQTMDVWDIELSRIDVKEGTICNIFYTFTVDDVDKDSFLEKLISSLNPHHWPILISQHSDLYLIKKRELHFFNGKTYKHITSNII